MVEQGLIECGYGDWTGSSLRELSKEKLWKRPAAAVGVAFPRRRVDDRDGEPARSARSGAGTAVGAEHGEDAVWAAVSHGDVIKAILADALGMHLDSFQRSLVDPAPSRSVRYTSARPYVIT